ncbi:hypothetical protein [Subtercola sp. RTI3]|uniref:hypothetical protein n=1 Tax=Subtercola sp. RTI3 TaxID=3048639 RepID=UPI002B22569A|nr:hypothetical protein [Subtercola sp. RTI3]MEA9985777.1 hypothetical protein [Subtercola sp. RTI3]
MAVDQLRRRRRQLLAGIGFLIGALVGAALGWVAFVVFAPADPPRLLVAAIGFAVVLSGCFGASSLLAAASIRRAAVTNAFLVVRRGRLGVSASAVSEALRSIELFDAWHSQLTARRPRDEDLATQRWTPNIRRPILPGPTARTLRLRVLIPLAPGLGIFISAALLGATGTEPTPAIWFAFWAAAALLFAAASTVAFIAARKGRAEFRSGYTTTLATRPPFDNQIALDLVDSKTGYLLRYAGSAHLVTATLQERRHQIRAAHQNAVPDFLAT